VFQQELNLQPFGLLQVAAAAVQVVGTVTNILAAAVAVVDYKWGHLIYLPSLVARFLMLLVQVARVAHKIRARVILVQMVETQLLEPHYKHGIYQPQAAAVAMVVILALVQMVGVVVETLEQTLVLGLAAAVAVLAVAAEVLHHIRQLAAAEVLAGVLKEMKVV
jgi:hypothetical protein